MSCLNLRFPPAKKAWKSFTSKIQRKLHKLNMPRSIKKSKYRTNNIIINSTFDHKRDENRKRLAYQPRALPFKKRSIRFGHAHKKSAPVFIDKLFREPVSDGELVAKFPPTTKTMKILDHQAATAVEPGTSMEDEIMRGERGWTADDMWESLGFASPQMQGIDERAERFILTFREEMEIQETIERGL
ncbi:hypothetical protein DKX38_008472 [Salix brachista]|uniref:COTTON FIBER (DUF761) n=2 Tax=Salix TaxID=40685 RepID=A0A9Q0SL99_9ROSI|nr:hypothetical protein DKX38_008472 [Salix brachista]KAJ6681210.1 COTTON FIBER (DUF761) [Salix koriyanagi]